MTIHLLLIVSLSWVLWNCFNSLTGAWWWRSVWTYLATPSDHKYMDHNSMALLLGSIAWMITALNVSGLFEIISTTSVYTLVLTFTWLVLISIGAISFYHLSWRSIMMLAMPSIYIIDMVMFFLIEVVSLSFRTISLSFRLCANILAGHLILHIVWGVCLYVIHVSAIGTLAVVGVFLFLCALEGFMALIQVYVFTMLSTVYLLEI